jgi:ABC-type nitrate/sulfonate/bicarbonate transport system ATPase subunit
VGTVAVRVSGARRTYGRGARALTVFDQLNLEVYAGELLVMVGPSGGGKSTLLRILAGLEALDAGRVEYSDRSAGSVAGVVFQQPLLLPWLTVRQNVGLGGRFRANQVRFEQAYADRLLNSFGLADLARRYPDELSGGQAQRVAVARAAAVQPGLLLLDEPFSALDVASRHGLQEWLRTTVDDLGLTAVLVTHDVDEAAFLGHRLALLDGRGGVRVHGNDRPESREDLLTHPARTLLLDSFGEGITVGRKVAG